jgi:hypothetical protein
VFKNRVLRRIFGPKSVEVTEAEETCIVNSYIIFTFH